MIAVIRSRDWFKSAQNSFDLSVITAPSAEGWMTPSRSSRWSEYPGLVDGQLERLAQADDPDRWALRELLQDVDVPREEVELLLDALDQMDRFLSLGALGLEVTNPFLLDGHVPTPNPSTLT